MSISTKFAVVLAENIGSVAMPQPWNVSDFREIKKNDLVYLWAEGFDHYFDNQNFINTLDHVFDSYDEMTTWAGEPDIKEIEL